MSKRITIDEVQNYVNALIVQYIEKKGGSFEKHRENEDVKIIVEKDDDISNNSNSRATAMIEMKKSRLLLESLSTDTSISFDTELEAIIYQHLSNACNDKRSMDDQNFPHDADTIKNGKAIALEETHGSPSSTRRVSTQQHKLRSMMMNATMQLTLEGFAKETKKTTFRTPPKTLPSDDATTPIRKNKGSKTPPIQTKRSRNTRREDRPQTAPAGSFLLKSLSSSSRAVGKGRSNENWIPDHIRAKMVQRDLLVAKQNIELNEKYPQLASLSLGETSPLERSRTKEKFGLEARKPCGLCCMLFLPVNLVMAVPLKAVFDMRSTWGDKFDPEGQRSRIVRFNPNLKRAPTCYDKTLVCAFCSQLFDQQQEIYRPSWEAKEAEKERTRLMEEDERKKVISDPLKQVDEERAHDLLEIENDVHSSV